MKKSPAIEKWQHLIEQAIRLRNLAPWKWMGMGKIFAIQDPKTKVNYYCSIVGGEGIHDGVQFMRGQKGLNRFFHMISVEYARFTPEEYDSEVALNRAIFNQCGLYCHFVNESDLDAQDKEILSYSQHSFCGAKQGIQFREVEQGCLPRNLWSEEEIVLLSTLIEQVIYVVLKEQEQSQIEDLLLSDELVPMLYRINQQGLWSSVYKEEDEMEAGLPSYSYHDEFMVKKINKLRKDLSICELICFHLPIPRENQDGYMYCPIVIVLVDINRKEIQFQFSAEQLEGKEEVIFQAFAEHILRHQKKPMMIYIADEELAQALEGFFEQVDIRWELVEYSAEADEVMKIVCKEMIGKMGMESDFRLAEERKPSGQGKIIDLFTGKELNQ